MKKLEENLIKLVDFINSYLKDNGFPPTVRDMCQAVGVTSTSTIIYYLDELENRGLIRRQKSKNRAIEVISCDTHQPLKDDRITIPLLGDVAAGIPILAEENQKDVFDFSKKLFNGDKLFMLQISGDSMIDVGMMDRDYIVVRHQNAAENGEIVVALIDDSATVKTFYKEKDHIRLQPENPLYQPILLDDAIILGKVVGVIRKVN